MNFSVRHRPARVALCALLLLAGAWTGCGTDPDTAGSAATASTTQTDAAAQTDSTTATDGDVDSSAATASTAQTDAADSAASTDSKPQVVAEATYAVAVYVRVCASRYFAEHPTEQTAVCGKVTATDGFGSCIMAEYPQLENMEYLIAFDAAQSPESAFCRQPAAGQESMASAGAVKDISALGVSDWDGLLAYYHLYENAAGAA